MAASGGRAGFQPDTDASGAVIRRAGRHVRQRGLGRMPVTPTPRTTQAWAVRAVRRTICRMTFTRITVDPDLMAGVPTIRGLRIPVATVVSMVADGMTVGEIC